MTTNRMYHSFPGINQYPWPELQDMSLIFPSSPAPSNCSSGPPQMQLDLYDSTPTSFHYNSFKELEDFYTSLYTDVSNPPAGRTDVWNAFNLSQLYSVNPRLPGGSAGQTPSGEQQLVLGDNQFPFPFDNDNFCLSQAAHKNHITAPIAPSPVPDPLPPPRSLPHPPSPTDQMSFALNSQLDGRNFLTCPHPSESVSKSDDPSCQGESRVMAPPPPKRQPTQRASHRSPKKRKTGKADNHDGIVSAFKFFFYYSHTHPNC